MDTPVFKEPLLGYYPCCIGFLTGRRRAVDGTVSVGQFDWGVASQRVTEAPKDTLSLDGNQAQSAKAKGCLTARPTSRAGTKVGLSDPAVLNGKAVAQRIKATLG